MTVGYSNFKNHFLPHMKKHRIQTKAKSVTPSKESFGAENKAKRRPMKSEFVPSRSTTATTVKLSMEKDGCEYRDSCYYPDCRKDANCSCEICLASIHATLDLMSISVQKSSLTKLSSKKSTVMSTPISFDESVISTPTSTAPKILFSPALKSTSRLNIKQKTKEHEAEKMKVKKRKREWGFWGRLLKWIICFSLISWMYFAALSPVLLGISSLHMSPEIVKNLGEKSCMLQDGSNGRLRFLQKELYRMLDKEISNCSYSNSVWKINQDGLLLTSHCTLFKSTTEELSIWGWPLQTAGLLKTGFSFRSFFIMSGRITEWPEGQLGYVIRKANTSWVHKYWAASAVQLDPNTWILEYKRSSIFYHSKWYSAAGEFLVHKTSEMFRRAIQEFRQFSAFGNPHFGLLNASHQNQTPT